MNTVDIVLGEDPELDALFAGKSIGDKFEAKVTLSVIETGPKSMRFSIDEIETDGEEEDKAEGEYKDGEEPVMAILAGAAKDA
jgi:hypothetical protein